MKIIILIAIAPSIITSLLIP